MRLYADFPVPQFFSLTIGKLLLKGLFVGFWYGEPFNSGRIFTWRVLIVAVYLLVCETIQRSNKRKKIKTQKIRTCQKNDNK